MEIYELSYPNNVTTGKNEAYSLAIGFFDGLHKGHQAVIHQAIDQAKALKIRSAVMTFNPHPSHVLGGGKNRIGYITPFEEKKRLLREMGVDTLFVVNFNQELAALSPEKFVEIFIKNLGVRHVTAGFDYTFGSKGAGTMEEMAELSDGVYETTVVGKVTDVTDKISSTRIRGLLSSGDVAGASALLGRSFRTIGVVVDGEKRGRELGFPTANVLPPEGSILPANGVYAVRFTVENQVYDGVCSVGINPTFEYPAIKQPVIEVHILHFNEDIYGKEVAVDWIEWIREEEKFDSLDALIEKIAEDKEIAIEILAE